MYIHLPHAIRKVNVLPNIRKEWVRSFMIRWEHDSSNNRGKPLSASRTSYRKGGLSGPSDGVLIKEFGILFCEGIETASENMGASTITFHGELLDHIHSRHGIAFLG
jgi:hypothetical protein